MKSTLTLLAASILCAGAAALSFADKVEVDKNIPAYQKTSGVTGTLNCVGSNTLDSLMKRWAADFKERYADVTITIDGKGSTAALPALIAGTAQLGPMSRQMTKAEIEQFEKKWGYKPTEIKVAVDALAVFVHKDNPIKGLSVQQLDAIFSSTHKRSASQDFTTWGQLGLTGEWASKPISLFGRDALSGTYGFFQECALDKGEFKTSVKEQPDAASIVQRVKNERGAIGYAGIGFASTDIRAIPVAASDGTLYEPTFENCLNGTYPMGRFLYIYVNKKPGEALDKLTGEFLRFVLSQEGQAIVAGDGSFPLTQELANSASRRLN